MYLSSVRLKDTVFYIYRPIKNRITNFNWINNKINASRYNKIAKVFSFVLTEYKFVRSIFIVPEEIIQPHISNEQY